MSAGIPDTTISDVSWYRSAVTAIQIGPHEIGGEDGRALVIAEAGVNHNGDLLLAHRLIDRLRADVRNRLKRFAG